MNLLISISNLITCILWGVVILIYGAEWWSVSLLLVSLVTSISYAISFDEQIKNNAN